ncbi:MAG: flavin-dependent dehydrogenase [Alphaproteobacteria bacterium]|jgi:flavin-dependent dehydrogenase
MEFYMDTITKSILVVGGGTAGWLTAALLAKQHGHSIEICLVESSDIPTVGVGEGTWPSMRSTLQKIGISESEFICECSATFKQASKFVNWTSSSEEYFHPFTQPAGYGKFEIAPYWESLSTASTFCDSVTFQSQMCKMGLAPKNITHKEYETVANYGYHLDAGKFAQLLKKHCVNVLNVKHIIANVTNVNQHQDGSIASVDTDIAGLLSAEFFIDCTGFSSLLLGQTLGVPFIDKSHILFNDTALAMHVPYANENDPIACHTISTAQTAGWIWDIGLQHRRGVGYVFSSKHESLEDAEQKLKRYIGPQAVDIPVRKIQFKTGHREVFWCHNCVAIGLSSGFLEPLEASALMLVETSANFIADQLPLTKAEMKPMEKRFNQVFIAKWRGIIDFLKLHYVLSERQEPYWKDNKNPSSIPDSLEEMLLLWQHRVPSEYDFLQSYEAFNAASYQYVLYGGGFKSDFSLLSHTMTHAARAKKQLDITAKTAQQMALRLPKHRDLINQIKQQGFAKL